ncbi:MAG TPA: DUF47 family protein [Candidatus Caldiarchaeum subterraneum]|uniref:DUF47 family protein n=1 Tax=Caldiarchaeum subterraneum TaxID=311458 RepID=A0A833EBU0_CALS0|nr:DUF47 family protein [Aigarchaeota archaeon]HIQ29614.1 DUF47 family protein [Candidatus Caldarchaeum subterraneum]
MFSTRQREQDIRMRLLSLTQDQMREVVDIIRKTNLLIENFCNDKSSQELETLYQEILKTEFHAREIKRSIEDEVTNLGALLTNKEDFIRLINGIDKISDIAEGVAFRVLSLSRTKLKVNKDIMRDMCILSDSVLKAVIRLREAVLAITLNNETFKNKVKETEDAERDVDDKYRNLDLAILQSEMRIPQLLLSREIVSMLEDIADKAEEVVENLRVLAFVIL